VEPLDLGRSRFELRSNGEQPDDVKRLKAALAAAEPQLGMWGGLETPVTVYVMRDHDDLEVAVRRIGYGWLRAWARYDDVLVQAPSTWGARDAELVELLLHELTHCVLFQRSGTRDDWHRRDIPLWFREGMAVWTAKQGRLYPSLGDIATWRRRNPGRDVFRDGERLSVEFYAQVYGYSLHAFSFFLRRFGEERVVELLAAMKAGARFAEAFAATTGLTTRQFERDFEAFLNERGSAPPGGDHVPPAVKGHSAD
jgi:hypothetical protein